MAENTVSIQPQLYRDIAELVRRTGAFRSVDEYVNVVLSELFGRADDREADQAEQQMLEERLRQLGYL
ncbi:MAG: CopG family transcriptional regulator [Candidatus Brocadiae bacterium]|nr:CopG family transcriptional regulator [Candidatus Brocadiia bacterium]